MKKYLEPEFDMSSVNFSTATCDTISGDINAEDGNSKGTELPIVGKN